jgi:Protein of unknown function (DUF3352)
MRAMRRLAATVATGLLLLAAGCGGGGEKAGTIPAGAEFAPATVPAFVTVNTDLDSEQWKTAERLSDKFPGREEALADLREELEEEDLDFDRDVRPALGDEIHAAWLDLGNAGENVVGFTKPKDRARFERLLESGDDPPAHREIDGWTVFAESEASIDRFDRARRGRSLADDDRFQDAMEGLPEDALARFYVRGQAVQDALEEGIAEEGGPTNLTEQAGRLEAVAGAASAEDEGVRFESVFLTDPELDVGTYEPALADDLPAGALALVSFGKLEDSLRDVLRLVGENVPNFNRQLTQAEQALGFSVERDLLPLFANEGGAAVYRGTPLPRITFALQVDDESKARRVLQRLGALGQLAGATTTRRFTVAGVRGTEIEFTQLGFSIFHAVFDGKLVVASSEEGIGALRSGGKKLAGDAVYREATEAAGLPDEVLSYLYFNLEEGLSAAFDFAEERGATVPADARANAEPLRSLLLYGDKDGTRTRFTGFLAID